MVQWVPLKVPLKRRLQTASVLLWEFQYLLVLLFVIWVCFIPLLWPPFILYLFYIIWDESPYNGGRSWRFFRSLKWWGYFCDYFPTKLVKEADLDPAQNYLFGYHPHGIIAVGCWGNFGTEGRDFSRLFPGIRLRIGTLNTNFRLPFFRELILNLGFVSAGSRSINAVLNSGPGASFMLVVGGAAEALNARPGHNDLTLNNRKGFVRQALANGAHLVPVFAFGENEIFKQFLPNPTGSPIRRWQERFKRTFGFSTPFFFGRGVFNYDAGTLPLRHAIVTVVGKPIAVPKMEEPTSEKVEEYHRKYVEALTELYDRYKDTYLPDRKRDLRFVE